MGFRSTICSQYYDGTLPTWFINKYNETILFPLGLLIVSKIEAKYYGVEFFEDYQLAIKESGFWEKTYKPNMTIAVLGEDDVISKVIITEKSIFYYLMLDQSIESSCVWQG